MNLLPRRTRSAIVLTALAATVPLAAAGTAGAAPARTAATSTYTSASYLQATLGLPASETNPAIKSVTLDRFQWILQQDGNFPIVIGDPATDPTFAARAQDVEAAADAAGIKDVYWFNPNLSGSAKVGATTQPALDIRNPASLNYLAPDSRVVFGDAWLSLVAQYLGNGVTAGPKAPGSAKIVATTRTATVNDAGAGGGQSTEVGNPSGGALYDYTTSDPADATESYFLIYNKARTNGGTPSKIASWVDLTDEPTSAKTKTDVATAVGAVGAANLATRDEFSWWKSANNAKQAAASSSEAQGKSTPVLTDEADNAAADGGWRVHQITYPELVFLLKTETSKDAVLLFGGTWCPNTRPVIAAINEEAQENDVTVFNFDTILDGGTDGGGNVSSNPLQSRNTVGPNAASLLNNNPSFLYADLVKQYLGNIKTEYDPATNSTVTYYPGGDNTKPVARIARLQVPFVVGYKGKAGDEPHGGATRQWIIDKGDGKYTEYMSQYWFTRPAANQLGITNIPLSAPIWAKINAALANFTWQTDPTTLYANTATDADDTDFLVEGDKAKLTETTSSVTVAVDAAGAVDASPSALAAALAALGAKAPANFAAAKTAYLAAVAASDPDAANLRTVVGAWGVAQLRKTRVNSTWGNATSPGSVAGGIAALRALDRFFSGLPGGVVSTQTLTAPAVDAGTAAKATLTITNDLGRTPSGTVTLAVKQGSSTAATVSAEISGDTATFTLPVLAAGTYDLIASFAGNDQIAAFSKSGSLTVNAVAVQNEVKPTPVPAPGATPTPTPKPTVVASKIAAGKLAGAVAKAPTAKKAGTYKVTIKAAAGKAAATGKVTLTLKKGKSKKVLTGTVKNGVVTVKVPKLAKGTWKVTLSWAGDATYLAAKVSGGSIKVKK